MITDKQKKFLENILNGKYSAEKNRQHYTITMNRIQKRIDHMFENTEWLAENFPDILSDFDSEYKDFDLPRRRRFKAFMKILKLISGADNKELIVEIVKKKPTTFTDELEITKSLTPEEKEELRKMKILNILERKPHITDGETQ